MKGNRKKRHIRGSIPSSVLGCNLDLLRRRHKVYAGGFPHRPDNVKYTLANSLVYAKRIVKKNLRPSFRTGALTAMGLELRDVRVHLNQWDAVKEWHIARSKK